jgi:uncharacterized protein YqfB (UPF0267 family)
MAFFRWLDRRRRPTPRFHPTVCQLEDRTVPSTLGLGRPMFSLGGAATQFLVVPQQLNIQSGHDLRVWVVAEQANHLPAFGYTGTVHFTLGNPDSGATVPDDYTFQSSDHGVHVFHFTLVATGAQTITATDTSDSSITGTGKVHVNPTVAPTHFLVIAIPHVAVGAADTFVVVAAGPHNRPITDYTGTVQFSSSDGSANLPGNYTFTTQDHGHHIFQATFATPGQQTLTVTDTTNSALTGQTTVTVNTAGTVTHFGVYSVGVGAVGFPSAIVVVALDANNNVVGGYTGTVQFSSSDGSATLPDNYPFQSSDNGMHVFQVTFATPGKQTVTVQDTADNTITGTTTVFVMGGF